MKKPQHNLLWLVASVVAALSWGCAGEPTAPKATFLRVSVNTTGGDMDDNYDVGVTGELHRALGTTGSTLFNVTPGIVSVSIAGIATNCLLSGSNPRSVNVRNGEQAEVRFDVDCATTGISVRTHTVGPDNPEFYRVSVNQSEMPVGINDSVLVSRLQPGTYSVDLNLPGDNCTAAGSRRLDINVSNREVTRVAFEVTCLPAIRAEKIAYVRWGSLGPVIHLMKPDGSGDSNLQSGDTPAWSPDGSRLVISTTNCEYIYYYYDYYPTCTGGLSLVDPETQTSVVLSNGDYGISPAWSPKNDLIAYTTYEGTNQSSLFLAAIDRSPRVRLRPSGVVNAFSPAWFPDGERLVFLCDTGDAGVDLCLINRDGSGFVRMTTGLKPRGRPAVSADGKTIAITKTDRLGSGEIELMSADGTDIRTLTEGFDPSWSRDGTALVFARTNGVYAINIDGTGLRGLTIGNHSSPVWRPGHE